MARTILYTSPQPELLRGKVALVTGGARGLGLETCRQLSKAGCQVILSARELSRCDEALQSLGEYAGGVVVCALDVSDARSIRACKHYVVERFGRLDILINNAGVYLDDPRKYEGACTAGRFAETLAVNVTGAFALIEAFVDGMRARNFGRVVNVSSGMGRCIELEGDSVAYRTSKAALNSLTKILAERERAFNIKINAVCPGWVRTAMGGDTAVRSVQVGARGIVTAASLPDDGYSGHLLRDGERMGCS